MQGVGRGGRRRQAGLEDDEGPCCTPAPASPCDDGAAPPPPPTPHPPPPTPPTHPPTTHTHTTTTHHPHPTTPHKPPPPHPAARVQCATQPKVIIICGKAGLPVRPEQVCVVCKGWLGVALVGIVFVHHAACLLSWSRSAARAGLQQMNLEPCICCAGWPCLLCYFMPPRLTVSSLSLPPPKHPAPPPHPHPRPGHLPRQTLPPRNR